MIRHRGIPLGETDTRYVNVTGDTMTGKLTIDTTGEKLICKHSSLNNRQFIVEEGGAKDVRVGINMDPTVHTWYTGLNIYDHWVTMKCPDVGTWETRVHLDTDTKPATGSIRIDREGDGEAMLVFVSTTGGYGIMTFYTHDGNAAGTGLYGHELPSSINSSLKNCIYAGRRGIANSAISYDSRDFILSGSVWDSSIGAKVEADIFLRNIVTHGTGGYRLAFLNDTETEFVTFEGDTTRVGVLTSTPNSPLHVNGSIATAFATKTSDYTLTETDSIIAADASGGAFTITLPTASGIAGRQYTIKKVDPTGNAVTVAATGTETIDGASTYSLSAQYDAVTIVSDGTNWLIVSTV